MSKLEEQFIIPPFSILDTKQGYWQKRKRNWLALGIKSEMGRGENFREILNRLGKIETGIRESKSLFSNITDNEITTTEPIVEDNEIIEEIVEPIVEKNTGLFGKW